MDAPCSSSLLERLSLLLPKGQRRLRSGRGRLGCSRSRSRSSCSLGKGAAQAR